MIDLKQLKALVKLMAANDLTEIDLHDAEGERVKIKRGSDPSVQVVSPQAVAPQQPAPAAAPPPPPPPAAEPAKDADEGLIPIPSPMVGTFYTASSPDAAPFVSVGATVKPDTVVCLVEAMKVFNEIKAEVSGTIQRVCVESGRAVEFGEPLFMVKPG